MTTYGFTPECYDFESTIIGFDYDLQFAFFDTSTCFDINKCHIYRQWDNPNAFIRCELVTNDGDIDAGVQFFYHRWLTELRYENPVREIIDVQRFNQSAKINVLTISEHNAMTHLIIIK